MSEVALKEEFDLNASEPKKWIDKISAAEKEYKNYYDLVKETREYYKACDKNTGKKGGRYNIFWSSIETLKPFLYFKQPRPYVDRRDKSNNPAEQLACSILERALEWDLSQFDFDSVVKYARNDFLISGSGILWEQYYADFKDVIDPDNHQNILQLKDSEKVISTYVSPLNFIVDNKKVGVWEDVSWIAKKESMNKQEIIEQFGIGEEDFPEMVTEKDSQSKVFDVYEVWDKSSKKVHYLSTDIKDRFLKSVDDPLSLQGFFPCPKPIFATCTNDSIIPVPDYCMIKEMLNELDGINDRMKLTVAALKVSGCYDNSFPELADILSKDVTLVSISDFTKLKENGGIRGVLEFAPIEQYVTALEQLAARRQDVIAGIFDITGVSDVMRGNSDPSDTATAVNKKTNFGTLRNQDRQNDMQRFLCDLFRIKAEIICEQFSAEKLVEFLPNEQRHNQELVDQAIALLKTDKLRNLALGIETDVAFNQEAVGKKAIEVVQLIDGMIKNALQTVSAQPLLLPLYKKMIESLVATLPNSRQFESVIEKSFDDISKQLSQPEPQEPDPRIAIEQQKLQIDAIDKEKRNQINQEKNQIQSKKIDGELALKNKEMDLQAVLKAEQIGAGSQNPSSANITTGFARGF